MSAPVDVLAVLAGAIEGTEQALVALRGKNRIECIEALEDLKEAHDAVAELIQIAMEFSDYVAVDHNDTSLLDREDMWDRLGSTISRVKGA